LPTIGTVRNVTTKILQEEIIAIVANLKKLKLVSSVIALNQQLQNH